MGKHFTNEVKKYIIEHYDCKTMKEIQLDLKTLFGFEKSINALQLWCFHNGVSKLETDRGFTNDENEWLIKNCLEKPSNMLAEEMLDIFGRSHKPSAIRKHCTMNLGLKDSNKTYLKKESYKRGMPIGTIMESNQGRGYLIKNENGKWVTFGRYIYESTFGEIPDGYKITFLDGNPYNTALSNLCQVSPSEFATLLKREMLGLGEITRTEILRARLNNLIKEDE